MVMFKKVVYAFLLTKLGQWLSRKVSGGWCFVKFDEDQDRVVKIKKDLFAEEHSFIVKGPIFYEGDPSALPDQGISNQRNNWKKWLVFELPTVPLIPRLYIDTYNARKLCFCDIKKEDKFMAIRIGHEPGTVAFGFDKQKWNELLVEKFKHAEKDPMVDHKTRGGYIGIWEKGQKWPFPFSIDETRFV